MVKWLVCTTEWLVGDCSQNSVIWKQSSRFFRAEVKATIISSSSHESPLSRSWRLVPEVFEEVSKYTTKDNANLGDVSRVAG